MSSSSIHSEGRRPDLPVAAAERLRARLETIGAWRLARHPVEPLETMVAACCDALGDSIMITDARVDDSGPVILWVNRGFTLMTGYGSDEVVGRSPRIFQGPRTDRDTIRRLQTSLDRGTTFTGETWNYRKDGMPFLMHWTMVPVHDETGRTRCFAFLQRDVTRQRQSDRELARRTRELETITSHCPDAILRLDRGGRVTYASDACQLVLGLRPGSMRLRSLAELGREGPAMDELLAAAAIVQAGAEPCIVTVPSPFGPPDRWLEVRIVPETERDGSVEHVVWFAREVTDRIRAERRARESEERERHQVEARLRARELEFRDLAESVPMHIWITDEHGVDIYGNGPWLAFTGRGDHDERDDEAAVRGADDGERGDRPRRGADWRHLIHPEDRPAFDAAFSASLERRVPFDVECRVERADGEERTLVISGLPREHDGRFLGILGTCLDITDRKRRDEMRQRALAELEHASRLTMAGQMAAAMVHELSQPLSAVATFIEIAARELEGGHDRERVLGSLRDAQRSALRAGVLSRRMLGFVRRTESTSERIDLGDCVRKGLGLMKGDARSRAVTLAYGGGLDGVEALADPVELEQVVCNLVRNAIEAIGERPGGGPRGGSVTVAGRVDGDRAELDVADDGPGVPESIRSELFEAFRTEKTTGIGLGLWICWNILERYAGEIRLLESRPGRTVFRVRLPLADVAEAGARRRDVPGGRATASAGPEILRPGTNGTGVAEEAVNGHGRRDGGRDGAAGPRPDGGEAHRPRRSGRAGVRTGRNGPEPDAATTAAPGEGDMGADG